MERLRTKLDLTSAQSLGACVRHMKTSSDGLVQELRNLQPFHNRNENALEQWHQAGNRIRQRKEDVYDPLVLSVASTLPHLESLELFGYHVNKYVLDRLTNSTIKHLAFDGGYFYDSPAQMSHGVNWPLETLDICLASESPTKTNGESLDPSPQWAEILRLCCSTLRHLRLRHILPRHKSLKSVSFCLDFPRLRFLDIDTRMILDVSAFRSLLSSERLSTLIIGYEDATIGKCLDDVRSRCSLEILVWKGHIIPATASLEMLKLNPQITSFGMAMPQSSSLVDRVLAIFRSSTNLTTLSLSWDGADIPLSSFVTLSAFTSLETLHMSSGGPAEKAANWLVNHVDTQANIACLENLRRFVFTRDTYTVNNTTAENYYRVMVEETNGLKNHGDRMLKYARGYIKVFKSLDFIHLGKLSFEINTENGMRVVASIRTHLNHNYDVMKNVFGIE
ncbi:hypothetical protein BJ170DRAFT_714292 [Xylariales sp. AK1849]|nr:hypothetical protein BJ170DRAFT_714292 [Xylariales sp. AK1849]